MRIALLSTKDQKDELLAQGLEDNIELLWLTDLTTPSDTGMMDACIDLLFDNSEERTELLKQFNAPLVIINLVTDPLTDNTRDFIRINGWTTFLKRSVVEASWKNDAQDEKAVQLFSLLNKKINRVADVPGFISARVIASIINEAFFSLEEGVSSKEEIDIAMKLGTNYPYGPFEWSEKIGLQNIYNLLDRLSKEQKRYTPATLLKKEAFL